MIYAWNMIQNYSQMRVTTTQQYQQVQPGFVTLFLRADPAITGVKLCVKTVRFMAASISELLISSSIKYLDKFADNYKSPIYN